ncbi:MAG: hypothetical protein JNJ94_13675 [Chlorobi bacterium]|nr:hypothetical protein [Chlorobiota bacterium]
MSGIGLPATELCTVKKTQSSTGENVIMGKNQQLGLIGAALLIAGAFAPVIQVPIVEGNSLTQWTNSYHTLQL